MSYARVIVNPAAGAGRAAKEWQQIRTWLKNNGLSFEHDLTEAPGHAIELAKTLGPDKDIVINMSGRGDKDMPQIARIMGVEV